MSSDIEKAGSLALASYLYQLVGSFLSVSLMAIASIAIARILGPEGYGIYSLSLSVPMALAGIADLGLGYSVMRFSSSLAGSGRVGEALWIASRGLAIAIISSSAISAALYIGSPWVASEIMGRPGLSPYIGVSASLVVFATIYSISGSALLALGLPHIVGISQLLQACAKLSVSIALLLLGWGVLGAIVGHISGYILGSVVSIAYIARLALRTPVRRPSNIDATGLFSFSSPIFISNIAHSVSSQYVYILLSRYSSPGDVGGLQASWNLLTPVSLLSRPILSALLPSISRLRSREELSVSLIKGSLYISALIVPASIGIAIFSPEILWILYGPSYSGYWVYLAVLASIQVVQAMLSGYSTGSVVLAMGDSRAVMVSATTASLAIVSGSTILIPTLGVPGLLISSAISTAISSLYMLITASTSLGVSALSIVQTASRPLIPCVLASAIPASILMIGSREHITALLIASILYIAIYLTVLPLSGLGAGDLRGLSQIARGAGRIGVFVRPLIAYMISIRSTAERMLNRRRS